MPKFEVVVPQFIDPPAAHRGLGTTSALLPSLKECTTRPGEWALIATAQKGATLSSSGTNIKRGKLSQQPHGKWDACTRALPDGSSGLWVKFERNGSSPS